MEPENLSNARIIGSQFMGAYTHYLLEWQGLELRVVTPISIAKELGASIYLQVKDAWSITKV